MSVRILHLLDGTTSPESAETLALLLNGLSHATVKLAALGHRSTGQVARSAGIPAEDITYLHSMGWLDPTGWRNLGRLVKDFKPTHLHAWGISAALAAAMIRFVGERLVSLDQLPTPMQCRVLPYIHKDGLTGLWPSRAPCRWIVNTSWLKRELHAHSIAADAVTLVRPPLPVHRPTARNSELRELLGLLPGDGPVLLLGGEGGTTTVISPTPPMNICLEMANAAKGKELLAPATRDGRGGPRHDLGVWAAAILQQVFPRIRVIVREDMRGRPDPGLQRLYDNLPDNDILVIAPASWSWADLLAVADAFVVTPDGPFSGASILHAFAAGVPVIGTPVESVRAYIADQQTGILSTSHHPRTIAGAIQSFLEGPSDRREKITSRALREAASRYDPAETLGALSAHYVPAFDAAEPAPSPLAAPAAQ